MSVDGFDNYLCLDYCYISAQTVLAASMKNYLQFMKSLLEPSIIVSIIVVRNNLSLTRLERWKKSAKTVQFTFINIFFSGS
jgi:hypothetical protein